MITRDRWMALVFLGGCVGSPGYPPSNDSGTSTSTHSGGLDASGTSTSAGTSESNSQGTSNPSTGTPSDSSGTTGEPPGPFVFLDNDSSEYQPVDRAGFPAVNTLLNLLGDKDAYNVGAPEDDANLMFFSQAWESLETLHLGQPVNQVPDNTGLDDCLIGLGLSPCVTPPLPMNNCDDQSAPFFIPDIIEIMVDEPAGFPNGRMLEDRVMDIILAVVLLDLQPAGPHPITKFVDFDEDGTPGPSLNPLANDVEFEASFPYLAPAH